MFFVVAGGSASSIALSIACSLGWYLLSQPFQPMQWLEGIPTRTVVLLMLPVISFFIGKFGGLVYQHWQGWHGEGAANRKHKETITALISRLPIETWLCQSSREHASVSELRQRLRRRQQNHGPQLLLEKQDLVAELNRSPHDTLCSICYEDYVDGEPLRLLACGHYFHIECLDRWLLTSARRGPACPLCNRSLLAPDAAGACAHAANAAPEAGGAGNGGNGGVWRQRLAWAGVAMWCMLPFLIACTALLLAEMPPSRREADRSAEPGRDMLSMLRHIPLTLRKWRWSSAGSMGFWFSSFGMF